MNLSRRTVLSAAVGTSVLGLAGCSGSGSRKADPVSTPVESSISHVPQMDMVGDLSMMDGRFILADFSSHKSGVSQVAVLSGKGGEVASQTSHDGSVSTVINASTNGDRMLAHFREVNDGGVNPDAFHRGEFVLSDWKFNQLGVVRPLKTDRTAGLGVLADMHDMLVLGKDHYLVMCYVKVAHKGRKVWALYLQEIASGKVVFEWMSTDHPQFDGLSDVKKEVDGAVDYLHGNSMQVTDDGDIILSLRNISTVAKVSRKTGKVMWMLGGKMSDFKGVPDFKFQHDARIVGGVMTMYDNNEKASRGLSFRIDEKSRSVSKVVEYTLPDMYAQFTGCVRPMPGDPSLVCVGWGSYRSRPEVFSVFDAGSAKVLGSLVSRVGGIDSYRMVVV